MENQIVITEEVTYSKIYIIRGQKVMLDNDLSELYGIEIKRLKEQVKRNLKRFPKHFMFELNNEEYHVLRSQIATLKRGEHSKYLPMAYTEHGILMLSNVLKSDRAISISISIINIFVRLRESLSVNTELWLEVVRIKKKLDSIDKNLEVVFDNLDQLVKKDTSMESKHKRIGYKPD